MMGGYGGYGGYSSNFNTSSVQQQQPQESGFMASPQPFGTPSAKKSSEQSLRPLTMKQVSDAKELVPDNPCVLDGHPIGNISVMGRIQTVSEQSTHIRYALDDGTGILEVSKWADKSEDDSEIPRESFTVGANICAIGPLRIFNGKKTLHANHIRLVTSMDELTHHQLMCIYTHLYLTKGPPSSMNPNNPNPNAPITPFKTMKLETEKPFTAVSKYTGLQERVLKCIRDMDNGMNVDGVKFSDLSYRMRGEAAPMDIRSTLDTLINESAIYTTSDDDTFKVSF